MKYRGLSLGFFLIGAASAVAYLLLKELPLYLIIALKVGPTLMMCAWLLLQRVDKSNWAILVGLVFSLLCDVSMALTGDVFLIAGIVSNMLALIFYTVYYVRSDASLDLERVVPPAVVIGVLYFVLYDWLGGFWLPVLVYCLIYIAFMWRSSARLGDPDISVRSQNVCFLGSVLITVSDSLLSLLIFKVIPDKPKYSVMVMILWWSGLLMLMLTAEMKRAGSAERTLREGNRISRRA